MSQTSAASLLATPVLHALWRMGWEELRGIQAAAIHKIRTTKADLVVSSPTASGKTEAAFLPILSHLWEDPPPSFGALYVGPLKALINDQFQRLDLLCEHLEIPVHRWHGDVSGGRKKKAVQDPRGVLLITPESLESCFVNRSGELWRMFHGLQYVVVDEFHAVTLHERGRHLRSLLHRIERLLERSVRIVGLSATLGDWKEDYARWIRPRDPSSVAIVEDAGAGRPIRLGVFAFESIASADDDDEGGDLDEDPPPPTPLVERMLEAFGGRKSLIFADRKAEVEEYVDRLNELSAARGGMREFFVHHGSLAKDVREAAEEEMRRDRPCSIVCSSTLELGIDVGDVERVGQIGAPWSVGSLVQRLGRSGRRPGSTSEMRIYVQVDEPPADAPLTRRLQLELVQCVALIRLMRAKWVEPPEFHGQDLSTLTQQILSVVRQEGGADALRLYDVLVQNGAFSDVSKEVFAALLRRLAAEDLLQQVPNGDLVLGLEGERVVSSYEFYTAFVTPVEYRVVAESKTIGRIPLESVPRPGERFRLAGRRWEVVDVDPSRRQVLVVPSFMRRSIRFTGGHAEVHAKVREAMREVLAADDAPDYLDAAARRRLAEARKTARESGVLGRVWRPQASGKSLWFTWTSTRVHRTLLLLAEVCNIKAENDGGVAVEFDGDPRGVKSRLARLLDAPPSARELASRLAVKIRRKYDDRLSDELLVHDRAVDSIDVENALALVESAVRSPPQDASSGPA